MLMLLTPKGRLIVHTAGPNLHAHIKARGAVQCFRQTCWCGFWYRMKRCCVQKSPKGYLRCRNSEFRPSEIRLKSGFYNAEWYTRSGTDNNVLHVSQICVFIPKKLLTAVLGNGSYAKSAHSVRCENQEKLPKFLLLVSHVSLVAPTNLRKRILWNVLCRHSRGQFVSIFFFF